MDTAAASQQSQSTQQLEQLEQLERAVQEIEALEAIYGCEDGAFTVHSEAELLAARTALDGHSSAQPAGSGDNAAQRLDIELQITLSEVQNAPWARLRFGLPPGYPDTPAAVSVSVAGMRRSAADRLSEQLKLRAIALAGDEAVMELVQHFEELAPVAIECDTTKQPRERIDADGETGARGAEALPASTGRRWIWAHHITDTDRRKTIVVEARELGLGGYLKFGYPGIIVVEGDVHACDEFVKWVKGSKARPNGFGRNWGHHVRGETVSSEKGRLLPLIFDELGDDMGALGAACSMCGLEADFKEYILQHQSKALAKVQQ